jgi:hypothetical protein
MITDIIKRLEEWQKVPRNVLLIPYLALHVPRPQSISTGQI